MAFADRAAGCNLASACDTVVQAAVDLVRMQLSHLSAALRHQALADPWCLGYVTGVLEELLRWVVGVEPRSMLAERGCARALDLLAIAPTNATGDTTGTRGARKHRLDAGRHAGRADAAALCRGRAQVRLACEFSLLGAEALQPYTRRD